MGRVGSEGRVVQKEGEVKKDIEEKSVGRREVVMGAGSRAGLGWVCDQIPNYVCQCVRETVGGGIGQVGRVQGQYKKSCGEDGCRGGGSGVVVGGGRIRHCYS